MKKCNAIFLMCLLTGIVANAGEILFKNVPNDYPWRIPAIVQAKNGDIVALGGYLECGTDVGWGRCDIYARVSKDNGASWGGNELIVAGTENKGFRSNGAQSNVTSGYGDAAVVADARSGRILLMCCTGGYSYWHSTRTADFSKVLRVARIYGEYDKKQKTWNWSSPEDVTVPFYEMLPTVNEMFAGSGRICQSKRIKVGDYYRCYMALCTKKGNYVLYTDDFGKSWRVLGGAEDVCVPKGDEPKCEELPDGNVLISSRTNSGRFFNIYKYSDRKTAKGDWGTTAYSAKCPGGISVGKNATNGEIMIVSAIRKSDGRAVDVALQSLPTANDRSRVAIYYKELATSADYSTPDAFASNWMGDYQVSDTTSAYSTMCLQKSGEIAFFYEENYTKEVLLGDGYDLIYQPLSLETITSGKYRINKKKK